MSTIEQTNVRAEISAFIRQQYDQEDELSTAILIDRCFKHFSDDDEFVAYMAREAVRFIVPALANEVRHNLRQNARNGHGAETPRERFARVFSHVGGDSSKSFLAMRRPDHVFAARNLEQRAKGALCHAAVHRAAAELHTDDEKTTGEVLTDGQIEFLQQRWLQCETPPVPWLTK